MPDAPPTMFAPALTAGDGQLTASWAELAAIWNAVDDKDGKNAITAYNLRYSEDGSGSWTEITFGITGTSHTITDLTNGMRYAVQVRAVNAGGAGTWSASSTATLIAPTVPPAAPGTMAAPTLYAGTERIVARWSAPDDNGSEITGYELIYREVGVTAWTAASGFTGTDHTYAMTNLTNGALYQVHARAINAEGAGPWSAPALGSPISFSRIGTPTEDENSIRILAADNAINTAGIANENLSILLTMGTHAVNGGDITVSTVTPPAGVTIPTVDANTGIVTVTASTTAGKYLIYGKTENGDILFAEYFYVTESPTTNAELKTAVTTGISNWGDTADFNYIITTAVTDMSDIFNSNATFNGDISGWDVSSVTDMTRILVSAAAFNGDISGWDVSSVTNMTLVLSGASVFNSDISGWDVSSVTDMQSMFKDASAFNSDISGWDVSSVTDMQSMFKDASAFNVDLEEWKDHWTVANGGINDMGNTDATDDEYRVKVSGMFSDSGLDANAVDDDDSGEQPNYPSWYKEIIAY